MSDFASPFVYLLLGVLLSVSLIEFTAYYNPARIPLRGVAARAWRGIAVLFLTWLVIAMAIYGSLNGAAWLRAMVNARSLKWVALAIGLAVPQLNWLVPVGLRKPVLKGLPKFGDWLIGVNYATVRYVPGIVKKMEREVSYRYRTQSGECAVDRLWELFVPCIVVRIAADNRVANRTKNARRARDTRDPGVKFKHMLRCFGYPFFQKLIQAVKENPQGIFFFSWPEHNASRRTNPTRRRSTAGKYTRDRRKLPYGRRKNDSRFLEDACNLGSSS